MKFIYALGKPRVSLLNILICSIVVALVLLSGLLPWVPMWVYWGFYSLAGLEAVLSVLKMRREP